MRKHATDPGHVEGNMVFAYLDFFASTSSCGAGLRGAGELSELKERYKRGLVSDVEVKEYLFTCLMEDV